MRSETITRLLCLSIFLFVLVIGGRAAARTVDRADDPDPDQNPAPRACTPAPNDCSLRGAIRGASADDTVDFSPNLTNATITLGSWISITESVTINGLGADKLTISGGNTTRIFLIGANGATFRLSGVTLANGNGSGDVGGAALVGSGALTVFDGVVFQNNRVITNGRTGGALHLQGGGETRILNSAFVNNSAPFVSCISVSSGSPRVYNSTFSGNSTNNFGAIYSIAEPVAIRNSTIVNNAGGGIYRCQGMLILGNSIVAGSGSFDVFNNNASIVTSGGNLLGTNINSGANFPIGAPNANGDYVGRNGSLLDPQILPLGSNGGATPTHAPLPNSLALNAGTGCVLTVNGCGDNNSALTIDQRSSPRKIGASVDIGAFESSIFFDQISLPNGSTGVFYSQTLTAPRQTGLPDSRRPKISRRLPFRSSKARCRTACRSTRAAQSPEFRRRPARSLSRLAPLTARILSPARGNPRCRCSRRRRQTLRLRAEF